MRTSGKFVVNEENLFENASNIWQCACKGRGGCACVFTLLTSGVSTVVRRPVAAVATCKEDLYCILQIISEMPLYYIMTVA